MSHGNADVIVIGGGAAGFFAAIHAAENGAKVLILEKTTKLLSKVKVSGGGRCNVTHDCDYPSQLVKFYPRGEKTLKKAFSKFDVNDTRRWFEERGVKLKTESDGRVFPVTDNSQTIIDCLMKEVDSKGIEIRMKSEVTRVEPTAAGFKLELKKGESISADKVIVTVGGSPKSDSYQ
ncbi:MAG: putative Rossmann fold flavoprotein, partial [Cryomorphaceae bacterium]